MQQKCYKVHSSSNPLVSSHSKENVANNIIIISDNDVDLHLNKLLSGPVCFVPSMVEKSKVL